MRPIDGEALYIQVAESEEKARDRLLDTSSSLPCPSYINLAYTRYNEQLNERTRLKHMIADAPTIELPERKKGTWGADGECPFCGYLRQWDDDNFCANCGADMRGEQDE